MKNIVLNLAIATIILGSFPYGAAALTVSPPRMEITGDPGTTVQSEISLFNEQDGTRTFYSSFENFEASGESGTPKFVGGTDGLAGWLSAPEQIILAPGERLEIPFEIEIPAEADPGGYFSAVFWTETPPDTRAGGQVTLSAKIGILILLRVSGDIEEGGRLQDFQPRDGQRFFSYLPIDFTYRFQNGGGDRIKPAGEVKIKNTFFITAATLEANPQIGNVLPGSTRKFATTWSPEVKEGQEPIVVKDKVGFFQAIKMQWRDFHFGWYSAKINLTFGSDNEQVEAKTNLFIIPWQFLTVIILSLAIILFVGRIGLRKYNSHIIKQAQTGIGRQPRRRS